MSMHRVTKIGGGCALVLMMTFAAGAARAQYDLPVPGLQTGPEEEQPIRPWRHWGDDHNDGEFVKSLVAPEQERLAPPDYRRHQRYCRSHPQECGY